MEYMAKNYFFLMRSINIRYFFKYLIWLLITKVSKICSLLMI